MEIIHHKEVKMKPRIYFVLGSALLALGVLINVFLAILFFTVCVFRWRLHGPLGYLWFGKSGLGPFLATFPWFFLLLGIAAIMGGILFLRKYDLSYKHNFIAIIVWLVVLVAGAGFLLDQVGFNERAEMMEAAKPLYKTQFLGENWAVGEVIEVKEDTITVMTPKGEEVDVKWAKDTMLPSGQDFILGDKVKIIGELEKEDQFEAKGINRYKAGWRKSIYNEMILQKKKCPDCQFPKPLLEK